MLALLNQTVVLVLVLCYLLLLLFGAPVAAWLVWRACKDLHRIADAAQHMAARFDMVTHDETTGQMRQLEVTQSRVANSMFAR